MYVQIYVTFITVHSYLGHQNIMTLLNISCSNCYVKQLETRHRIVPDDIKFCKNRFQKNITAPPSQDRHHHPQTCPGGMRQFDLLPACLPAYLHANVSISPLPHPHPTLQHSTLKSYVYIIYNWNYKSPTPAVSSSEVGPR